MELMITNSFDPTPKLNSSTIPITFIPFKYNIYKCHCGHAYTETVSFCQKYCKCCLAKYLSNITVNNTYLDVLIRTYKFKCNKHEARDTDFCTQNIHEWCENCSIILYKQVYSNRYVGNRNLNLVCELCGDQKYNGHWKTCSNCYKISSGWVESILTKKLVPILYLPWWDQDTYCMGCKRNELKNVAYSLKWCEPCQIIYNGCRYCLTTNIIFGITDQSQCIKCKRTTLITLDAPLVSSETSFISSGNSNVDEFIHYTKYNSQIVNSIAKRYSSLSLYKVIEENPILSRSVFKWIPFSQIQNLEQIAVGGFGIIYKANYLDGIPKYYDQFKRDKEKHTIAIKRFLNSKDISKYFLNELVSHHRCCTDSYVNCVMRCYGITKDPETNDYMLVMDYASGGDLHNHLQSNFINTTWNKIKLGILWNILDGLETIHKKEIVHRDIHSGNILFVKSNAKRYQWQIGDLGLSQPAYNTPSNDEIYGVIPYIAPEVFNGASFSKKSDIYSIGMIMWELTTGCKPFSNIEHDHNLIYHIFKGKRPEITNDTPECYANLMKLCWDSDPSKRPSIKYIRNTVGSWFHRKKHDERFNQAEKKRKELIKLKKLGPEFAEKHPKAIYTSRILNSLISRSSSLNSLSITQDEESKDEENISKEFEFDFVTRRLAINGNSTIQDSSNTQQQNAISTSKPSKKRNIEEIEDKIQVNKKQIKSSSENPNIL